MSGEDKDQRKLSDNPESIKKEAPKDAEKPVEKQSEPPAIGHLASGVGDEKLRWSEMYDPNLPYSSTDPANPSGRRKFVDRDIPKLEDLSGESVDYGPVRQVWRYAILGKTGQGKTTTMVYLMLKELWTNPYIEILYCQRRELYLGNPFDPTNPLPVLCHGECRTCKEKLAAGKEIEDHKIRLSSTKYQKVLEYWDQVSTMRNAVFGADELGNSLNSLDFKSNKAKIEIDKNMRAQNNIVYSTEQSDYTIDKRSRINYDCVILPVLHIAKTPEGQIDLENPFVKNDKWDREYNMLELHFYNVVGDAAWTRFVKRAGIRGINPAKFDPNDPNCNAESRKTFLTGPDKIEWVPVPPSVIFQYYNTLETVNELKEITLNDSEIESAATKFEEFLTDDKEMRFLWNDYLDLGKYPRRDYLEKALKVWNNDAGLDGVSLERVHLLLLSRISERKKARNKIVEVTKEVKKGRPLEGDEPVAK